MIECESGPRRRGAATLVALALLAAAATAAERAGPYDPQADAAAAIERARARAAATDRLVMILFGANWCPDCRRFAELLRAPEVARLVEPRFVVAKVDVGNWDRNLRIARRYGNPIEAGIPAAVFLAPDGEVLAATRRGELARAREFEAADALGFLEGIVERGRPRDAGGRAGR